MKAPIKNNSEVRFIADRHSYFIEEGWRAIAPEHLKFPVIVDPYSLINSANSKMLELKIRNLHQIALLLNTRRDVPVERLYNTSNLSTCIRHSSEK